MPDKDTKPTVGAEVTPGDTANPDRQDFCPRVFHDIKYFVLCHSLLQLTQLMISGYFKSSISTVEKRFGFSSQTSGLLASFNEVGNTALIVFVSYFGSQVHRPRFIGFGALLVAVAGLLMTLPHFISEPYRYDHINTENVSQSSSASLCLQRSPSEDSVHPNANCANHTETQHLTVVGIMLMAQTLLGMGVVPIQPFGISYIDDFAHDSNSPLYLGVLFAMTMMGPALAYGLGSIMLSFYVDIDRMPPDGISLTPKDPRWVGAWWLGFLVAAGSVALSAIPYFFFPREMPKEKQELYIWPRGLLSAASPTSENTDLPSEQSSKESQEKQNGLTPVSHNLTLIQFIKVFPKVLLRNLRHPIFLLVVLSQVCMSSMVAGLATFLPKFLELQFSITASFANLLIGCFTIPSAIVGIVAGGVLIKHLHFSPMRSSILCLLGMLFCILLTLPLFFIGCQTHQIAGIFHYPGSQPELEQFQDCVKHCSCPLDDFNPVCEHTIRVEYPTPCQAGCINWKLQEVAGRNQVIYTNCSCVPGDSPVLEGSCGSACNHLVLPFMLLISLGATLASLAHTPSFMLILRGVKKEDKTLAVGIQFMLVRMLAWMPSPVIHGSAIDTTCVHWTQSCGSGAVCRYYNHNLLRFRFIGLQFFFKLSALLCFILIVVILRQQNKVERAQKVVVSPKQQQAKQQQPLVSRAGKKAEDSQI